GVRVQFIREELMWVFGREFCVVFFFSSRRRHTRCLSDWSSDVCSSDLGEGAVASRELGEFEAKTWINGIVQAIRAVKADQESLRLQNEFYERSRHPLDTPQ